MSSFCPGLQETSHEFFPEEKHSFHSLNMPVMHERELKIYSTSLSEMSRSRKHQARHLAAANFKVYRPPTYKFCSLNDALREVKFVQEIVNKSFHYFVDFDRSYSAEVNTQKDDLSGDTKLLTPSETDAFANILRSTPTLIVCGEVNAGKSAFINFLLGNEIMPVDELPMTSKIVHITQPRNRRKANCTFISKKKRFGNWDVGGEKCLEETEEVMEFLYDFIGTSEEASEAEDFVQIELPNQLTKLGVDIIECPGVDGSVTYAPIMECIRKHPLSLIIFVMDITDGVTKVSEFFLNYLAKQSPETPVFFVLNKLDAEDDEVLARDRPDYLPQLLALKSPMDAQKRDRKMIEKMFRQLNYLDALVNANSATHEAANYAPVSLLKALDVVEEEDDGEKEKEEEEDPQVRQLTHLLSRFCLHGFWQSLFPIYCRLHLLLHAIVNKIPPSMPSALSSSSLLLSSASSSSSSVKQLATLRRTLTEILQLNEQKRKRFTKALNRKLHNQRKQIVKSIAESVEVHSWQNKSPRHWLGEGRLLHSQSLSEQISMKLERKMLNAVQHFLRASTFEKDCLAERNDFVNRVSAQLEDNSRQQQQQTEEDAQFLCFVRFLFKWKKIFMKSVRLTLTSRVIFEEEKLMKQFMQACKLMFKKQSHPSEGEYFSLKHRIQMAENLFSRINIDCIIRSNFDTQKELIQYLLAILQQYERVQETLSSSTALHYFSNVGNLQTVYMLDVLMKALKQSKNKGFECPLIRGSTSSSSTSSSSATRGETTQNGSETFVRLAGATDAPQADRDMIRRVPCDNFLKLACRVDFALLHNHALNMKGVLYCARQQLSLDHELVLCLPYMETDLFHLLQLCESTTRIYKQANFQGKNLRLNLLNQIIRVCCNLQTVIKGHRVVLRPEFILLNFDPTCSNSIEVKVYIYENKSEKRSYPDGNGPYLWMGGDSSTKDCHLLKMDICMTLWWLCFMKLCQPPTLNEIAHCSDEEEWYSLAAKSAEVELVSMQEDDRGLLRILKDFLQKRDVISLNEMFGSIGDHYSQDCWK